MIVVKELAAGELGERSGLCPGDKILSINGRKTADLLDFQVQSADEFLLFEVEREGEVYEVDIERAVGDSFGIEFEELPLRSCNNKCVFCFIHQMPKGLRKSLYFEDDDFRLSFLHGSYVTLTNVKDRDLDRIIDQGLTPQYVSVHATEPDLRMKMLGRKRATVDIMERLKKLADGGIEMHTQVVVCPGWNDGEHLERTVRDLRQFYPAVRSVALVPVGLTKFRDDLPHLEPVTEPIARSYVEQAEGWGEQFRAEIGERFVYAADELFILSGQSLPPVDFYDAFPQLENGIGMVRSFLDTWNAHRSTLPPVASGPMRIALVTGVLAASFMESVVDEIGMHPDLQADLLVVENDFFGRGITVSGLLTGEDICRSIEGEKQRYDAVFLPPNCVNGQGLTLDEYTVDQLIERVGMPLYVGDYDLARTLGDFLESARGQRLGQGRQLSELGYYVGRRE